MQNPQENFSLNSVYVTVIPKTRDIVSQGNKSGGYKAASGREWCQRPPREMLKQPSENMEIINMNLSEDFSTYGVVV